MNPRLTAYNFTQSESNDEIKNTLESLIDREKVDIQVLPEPTGDAIGSHGLSLIFVPDTGFDKSQSILVEEIADHSVDAIFTIIVTDGLLEVGTRQTQGLKSLCEEIQWQYGKQPVCIPTLENMRMNAEPLKSFKLFLERRITLAFHTYLLKEKRIELAAILKSLPNGSMQKLQSFADIGDMYDRLKLLEECKKGVSRLRELYMETETHWLKLEHDWSKALPRLRDNTVRVVVKQDAATYYSHFMASPFISIIEKLKSHLEQTWKACPDKYKPWLDEFSSFAFQPRLLMPIVGLFSSGKTTFINSLLNPTPEKNECLRTATTHNTAILLCLKGSEPNEPDSVNFTWKSYIDIPILEEQTESRTPKRSPARGIVAYVKEIDPFAIVKIDSSDNPNDFCPPIIVLKSKMKSRIKPGYKIESGELLTTMESQKGKSVDGCYETIIHPYALNCCVEFIKQGLLEKVDVRVYSKKHVMNKEVGGYSEKLIDDRNEQLLFLASLQKKANHAKGRGSRPLCSKSADDPVKVNLSATLDAKKSPDRLKPHILLDSGLGWDEFQGRTTDSGFERGFAESDYAAWLLEKADLRVDNPLFKIVELVDTPGINSISQHHDRITFDYINRGNAFIIIIGLRVQDKTQDLVLFETLIRVVASFVAQKVDKCEWGERTFIVFNWFHKNGVPEVDGDVVIRRIENLKSMLSTLFVHSEPKIYLIDASQTTYDDYTTLLGYPSILQLIDDIPKMVNKYFLFGELEKRLKSLKGIRDRSFRFLDETIERLTLENNDEYLERLRSDIKSVDGVHGEINRLISEEFHNLYNTAEEVRQVKFESKEEFAIEKIRCYSNMMDSFNKERNGISDIVSDCRSIIKKKYGRYTALSFTSYDVSSLVNNIPTFLPDDFRAELDQIITEWPSWFNRVIHRIRKGFREGWLDSVNNELRNKYYSDQMLSAIADNIAKLKDDIIRWVDSEFNKIEKHLNSELENMTKSRSERNAEIERKKAERRVLEEFEENYTATNTILQKAIRDVQGGKL